MKPKTMYIELPNSIQNQCTDFITNYKEPTNGLLRKLTHDNTWKDTEEDLKGITADILNTL